MGWNYPRDNGKVFFILRVLMNINGIPGPFLCFLFPLGREIIGGKLPEAEVEWNAVFFPPTQDTPKCGNDFVNANAFPFCPAGQKLFQVESNLFIKLQYFLATKSC